MTNPRVSVVMPVFNGEEYIRQAIESVLSQTYTDLELLIITELGSSPASIVEVERIKDPRIIHVQNKEKLGLIASLNLGLNMARGEYIARMDSDDVSLPGRLEKQVAHLGAHPEVGILGTRVWYIDGQGKRTYKPRYFWRPEAVAWDMYFNSPVPHPSAMMRRDLVMQLGGYDPSARLVEDYDLWIRASRQTIIANLPEELVLVRKHGENITIAQREEQNRAASRLVVSEFERLLGRKISEEDVRGLRNPSALKDGSSALRAADLLSEAYVAFLRSHKSAGMNEIKDDAARRYSVLVATSVRERFSITGPLLMRAKKAGLSRATILPQAMARLAMGK